jgi:hypothetical protein
MTAHQFSDGLRAETAATDLCDSLWRAWFGATTAVRRTTSLADQRRGVDGVLEPVPGWLVTFQEKARAKDWGDVLLETVSSTATKRPGWAFTCEADVLLYAITPPRRGIILPPSAIAKALTRHRPKWEATYGIKRAPNAHYDTLNVAVPTSVLRAAIDEEHGSYRCSRCDAPDRLWSSARGGAPGEVRVGCDLCHPSGPSSWTVSL